MKTDQAAAESQVARWVHRVLLSGVIAGGVLLSVGLALAFYQHVDRPDADAVSIVTTAGQAFGGDPVAILYSALLVIILTPVARVAVLVVGWWLGGDRRFALVALTVFLLLSLSFWIGTG